MTEMKIIKCTCLHSYQDELYGAGMRAANPTASGQFRCTVCGTVHGSQSASTVVVKKAAEPAVKTQPAAKKTPEKKKPDDKKKDNKGKEKKGSLKGGKR
jgi:hypothetical protein